MRRRIAILGSTGSIGTQALEVISHHPDKFEVTVLAANNNSLLLIEQAKSFKPDTVVITNEDEYLKVKSALDPLDIKVYTGNESLHLVVESEMIDMVLIALVGIAGLQPAINAIRSGKAIALANKEVMVVAGKLITSLAMKMGVPIIPVDSEHSAIFQCISGEMEIPEKIFLTASGGPFRGMKMEQLRDVTVDQALKHPKWSMGSKISIDSATMMNKGLEVIEAKWLFNIDPERIQILVHPESLVHSMVQFADGAVKAQLGIADMRIPIQYALSYPYRLKSEFGQIDFLTANTLTFEAPDFETFKCMRLAYQAINMDGNMPCVLNAANEVAVDSFLCGKIRFLEIPDVIQNCMNFADYISSPDLESLLETNRIVREHAATLCKNKSAKP